MNPQMMLHMMNSVQVTPQQQQWIDGAAQITLRQAYGDRLFVIIQDSLEAAPMAAAGFNAPLINPYKITGMILESCTLVELWGLLNDSKKLADVMLQACDVLQEADDRCREWTGIDSIC